MGLSKIKDYTMGLSRIICYLLKDGCTILHVGPSLGFHVVLGG